MTTDMNAIRERLKRALDDSGLSYSELEKKTGIPRSSLHRYINGMTGKLPFDGLEAIAKATGVSPGWLMGWDNADDGGVIPYGLKAFRPSRRVPRLGRIPCGTPNEMFENKEGFDELPEGISADYTLVCEGDSMINAQILDGDVVYIRQQETVANGDIAAVWFDGRTTLKRFYQNGDTVTLMPENPKYAPIFLSGKALEDLRVLGKAVGFTRIF